MNRNTKQRQIIYQVVMNHQDHPDVDTIYQDVHKIDSNISLGTIYRNLNILSSAGLIQRVKAPHGDRYDFRLDEHDHIVCQICNKVFDSPSLHQASIHHHIEAQTGFRILSHRTIFEGICPECLKRIHK